MSALRDPCLHCPNPTPLGPAYDSLSMNSPAKRSVATLGPLLLVALAVFIILSAGNKGSVEPGRPEALYAGLPSYRDHYGAAVATDGSVVLVGAPAVHTHRTHPGTAYVFAYSNSTWSSSPLEPSVPPPNKQLFGSALAIDGPLAVVGAPATGSGQGAAYVFALSANEWIPEAVFTGPGEQSFGASVAVSGDTVVIGAPDAGTVYVYTPCNAAGSGDETAPDSEYGWMRQQLTSASAVEGGGFGTTIAADEGLIAVGAPNENEGAGTVTVFRNEKDEWLPVTLPNVSGLSGLGSSLDLDLPHLVAGAPDSTVLHNDEAIESAGRVLVWTITDDGSWTGPLEPLAALWEPKAGTRLGSSVALLNGAVAVAMEGRPQWHNLSTPFIVVSDIDHPEAATPYSYTQLASQQASENVSVAMAGDLLIVGAPHDDSAQWMNMTSLRHQYPAPGSAWVFHRTMPEAEP
jgi:hypothetical protein